MFDTGYFRYYGCGDPADSKHEWGNMLPVVPKSKNEDRRQRQCARWGCYESVLGSKCFNKYQFSKLEF